MNNVQKAIKTLEAARLEAIAEMNACSRDWQTNKIRKLQIEASRLADGIGLLKQKLA